MEPQPSITHPPARQASAQTSHARWQAVVGRSPAHHSSFFYAVKSTLIYCRPTCTARTARRANVLFYDTAAEAEAHGFRPCKRCKPDDPSFMGDGEAVVSRVLALLRASSDAEGVATGLKALAERVGVTPSYLARVFKRVMGVTVGDPGCRRGNGEEWANRGTGLAGDFYIYLDLDDFDLDQWISTEDFSDTALADRLFEEMERERINLEIRRLSQEAASARCGGPSSAFSDG
ncbi:hypothetical protein MBLNU230_g6042t1 [Neophaeotheca triangularis]